MDGVGISVSDHEKIVRHGGNRFVVIHQKRVENPPD